MLQRLFYLHACPPAVDRLAFFIVNPSMVEGAVIITANKLHHDMLLQLIDHLSLFSIVTLELRLFHNPITEEISTALSYSIPPKENTNTLYTKHNGDLINIVALVCCGSESERLMVFTTRPAMMKTEYQPFQVSTLATSMMAMKMIGITMSLLPRFARI